MCLWPSVVWCYVRLCSWCQIHIDLKEEFLRKMIPAVLALPDSTTTTDGVRIVPELLATLCIQTRQPVVSTVSEHESTCASALPRRIPPSRTGRRLEVNSNNNNNAETTTDGVQAVHDAPTLSPEVERLRAEAERLRAGSLNRTFTRVRSRLDRNNADTAAYEAWIVRNAPSISPEVERLRAEAERLRAGSLTGTFIRARSRLDHDDNNRSDNADSTADEATNS